MLLCSLDRAFPLDFVLPDSDRATRWAEKERSLARRYPFSPFPLPWVSRIRWKRNVPLEAVVCQNQRVRVSPASHCPVRIVSGDFPPGRAWSGGKPTQINSSPAPCGERRRSHQMELRTLTSRKTSGIQHIRIASETRSVVRSDFPFPKDPRQGETSSMVAARPVWRTVVLRTGL